MPANNACSWPSSCPKLLCSPSLPSRFLQGSVIISSLYNGLPRMACGPPVESSQALYQRMPWLFIPIALVAAAILAAIAW